MNNLEYYLPEDKAFTDYFFREWVQGKRKVNIF